MIQRTGWFGLVLLLAARAGADAPDAAALVRSVRAQEAWIDRVESFRLKAEVAWKRSPKGMAMKRKELQAQFPGASIDAMLKLEFKDVQITQLAFDRQRILSRNLWPWGVDDLRVWDGKRYIGYALQKGAPEHDSYLIARDVEHRLDTALSNLCSFRTAPHPFWWLQDRKELAEAVTKPEEFAYAGRDHFEKTECDVVCRWGSWDRYYIDRADGRLRGLKVGAQTRPDTVARILDHLRRGGHDFRDEKEYAQWYRSRSPEEVRALDLEFSAAMLKLTDPIFEFGLADYKELRPGCWFPMTQTYTSLFLDDDGQNAVEMTQTLKVTEIDINEPLPDSLFEVKFKAGAQVVDLTSNPPLIYRHKEKFTPEEWAKIVAEGRERSDRDQTYKRKQASLIGLPAPDFPAEATWLGGKPLRWADLRGKPVVLDFWAEWCGPCRNDLPTLSTLHKKREENGLIVIGVHPPGSKPAAIEKVIEEFDLAYPICIDVPPPDGATSWGSLFETLGVDRIPHAVLVDREGKIVATGDLSDVALKGLELGKAR